jgi:hypothetical protein
MSILSDGKSVKTKDNLNVKKNKNNKKSKI